MTNSCEARLPKWWVEDLRDTRQTQVQTAMCLRCPLIITSHKTRFKTECYQGSSCDKRQKYSTVKDHPSLPFVLNVLHSFLCHISTIPNLATNLERQILSGVILIVFQKQHGDQSRSQWHTSCCWMFQAEGCGEVTASVTSFSGTGGEWAGKGGRRGRRTSRKQCTGCTMHPNAVRQPPVSILVLTWWTEGYSILIYKLIN